MATSTLPLTVVEAVAVLLAAFDSVSVAVAVAVLVMLPRVFRSRQRQQ